VAPTHPKKAEMPGKSVVPAEQVGSFRILHTFPPGPIEERWRACLANSNFPTHYAAPEFFLEPTLRAKKPFAILSVEGEEVTGVLTGIAAGGHVQSGLSVRPQMAFSRRADRARATSSLVAGLLTEGESANLVDLFVWSDMDGLVGPGFHQRRYEGVVMLDLSLGPDALFRKFSENRRTNIKKAIKYGVSVAPATSRAEISAYYRICADWSLRKRLPLASENEFQQNFALTDNRLLLLARHKDNIVAGAVVRFFPRGVMEYAANCSLENALHLRPNDLLQWRAIEWGYRAGLTKYNLGGTHPFLLKFGGQITPTTRCRLDRSLLHRYTIRDWVATEVERLGGGMPKKLLASARSLRERMRKRRSPLATRGRFT
jgi:hypothetical protein